MDDAEARSEPITTFSGSHPFRPSCLLDALEVDLDGELDRDDLVDQVAEIVEVAESGSCARCGRGLKPREIPSGSRVTTCRCIPICSRCSVAEAWAQEYRPPGLPSNAEEFERLPVAAQERLRRWLSLEAGVSDWPLSPGQIADAEQTVAKIESECRLVTLVSDSAGNAMTLDEDGFHGVMGARPTTGRAALGYDDQADREERER